MLQCEHNHSIQYPFDGLEAQSKEALLIRSLSAPNTYLGDIVMTVNLITGKCEGVHKITVHDPAAHSLLPPHKKPENLSTESVVGHSRRIRYCRACTWCISCNYLCKGWPDLNG